MKNLGVTANLNKPDAPEILRRLEVKAADTGFALFTSDDTCSLLKQARCVSAGDLAGHIDVMLALGGDGTMLQAVRLLQDGDVPLMGVNLGELGFLTSVSQDKLETALDVLREGTYEASTRHMVECEILRNEQSIGRYRGLNDIVIGWGSSSRIVTLDVIVNRRDVTCYTCDGLIFSTPTGSTGHSLSAGGPIIYPEAPVYLINIICPHTRSNRPVIIPDETTVEVVIQSSPKELLLAVDGQDCERVREKDRIIISRPEKTIQFLNLPHSSYFALLRQKLHWRGTSIG